MRFFLFFLFVTSFQTSDAELFTKGATSQIYWNWRPDIADSCYEFTFVNYKTGALAFTNYCSKITLFYWDDCDYGKNMISDSNGMAIIPPLHDTLYRITHPAGVIDTFCGYNAPYDYGLTTNFSETTSPHRRMVVYRGLIYLPEKCRNWHFVISEFNGFCVSYADEVELYNNTSYGFINTKSNIDSLCFDTYTGNIEPPMIIRGVYGCSMNNLDFPNNSSVRFTSPPIYYYATDKLVEYNPGPYDPDHDSLSITITDTIRTSSILVSSSGPNFIGNFFRQNDASGNPYDKVFTENVYFAPLPGQIGPNPLRFNAQNNPFDTDSTFHLVDSTGRTTFNAQSTMQPILYYSAKKYREQKFVNETYFVNQFTLLNDVRPTSFMKIDTTSLQGAYFNGEGTMIGCADKPITFNAYIKLPFAAVSSANLIVKTTVDSTLPGNATCNIIGLHTDSVNLTFNWIPPLNSNGLFNAFISAKDSNCMLPYHHFLQMYTWSFYIDSCTAPILVSDIEMTNKVVIYPNPAKQEMTIESFDFFNNVKIYNLLSELVVEKDIKSTKTFKLSIGQLPPGIYMVNIDGKYKRKFIVE